MDPKTGWLNGTPLQRHIGSRYWVTVSVIESGGMNSTTFELIVLKSPNKPPKILTLIETGVITKNSNERWIIKFEAEDDYTSIDDLIWSLESDATWLSINSTTGVIDVQFDHSKVGEYSVNITVIDEGGLYNKTAFILKIISKNNAPTLLNSGITPKTGNVNTMFTFFVIYKDQDNDSGIVRLVLDGEVHLMKPTPSNDNHYSKGVNFTYKTKLSKGYHEYYFTAVDKWDFEAKYGKDVPSQEFPLKTEKVNEIIQTPYYSEPVFWIVVLVIILIIFCLFLMLVRPEQFNPIVRARVSRERQEDGEFGYLCPICKEVISEDAEKCEKCGEQFIIKEYICPSCQAMVSADDIFCSKCGAKFEELEIDEPEPEEPEAEEPEAEELEDEELEDEEFEEDETEDEGYDDEIEDEGLEDEEFEEDETEDEDYDDEEQDDTSDDDEVDETESDESDDEDVDNDPDSENGIKKDSTNNKDKSKKKNKKKTNKRKGRKKKDEIKDIESNKEPSKPKLAIPVERSDKK